MEVRILRRREVERLTRLSKASIYRKMRTGTFPLPLKLGERAVAWRADEIHEWIASRPRAGLGACSDQRVSAIAATGRESGLDDRLAWRGPAQSRGLKHMSRTRLAGQRDIPAESAKRNGRESRVIPCLKVAAARGSKAHPLEE